MKTFILHYWQRVTEIFIILLTSLIPWSWFASQKMVLGYDSGYPINFTVSFPQWLSTWMPSANFGTDLTSVMGEIPFHGILYILRIAGIGHYDVQKIIFTLWWICIAMAIYLLTNSIFPKKEQWAARLIGVGVYIFNFHILPFWIQGEQTTFSLYVFLPLSIWVMLLFLRNEISPVKASILISIFYFVFNSGGIYGIPLLGAAIFANMAVIIFYLVQKGQWLKLLKNLIMLSVITCIVSFFLNAYFILPFLSSFHEQFFGKVAAEGGIVTIVSWADYISTYSGFSNLIRLQGDLGWYDQYIKFAQPYITNLFLIMISFIFPLLAFSSYFIVKDKKQKKLIVCFLLIAAVGLFLTAGTHAPFGAVYTFLLSHIPGFAAFRSPFYKFDPILYLSYAVLIGIFVDNLRNYFPSKLTVLISIFIIVMIPVYYFPFFNNSIFNLDPPYSTMVHVPSYITNFGNYVNTHSTTDRTLVVPPVNSYPIKVYNWGYWSPLQIFSGFTDKSFVQNDSGLSSDETSLVNALYKDLKDGNYGAFSELASQMDIQEILLTGDQVDNYPSSPTESPSVYKNALSNNFFHEIWHQGPWYLYTWDIKNKSKEISVFSSYSLLQGDDVLTPMLNTSQSNFILGNQIANTLPIPPSTTITSYSCISCVFSTVDTSLTIPTTQIFPGSVFYPLKQFLDQRSVRRDTTPQSNIDTYIGLSLKRVSEAQNLPTVVITDENSNDWVSAINSLATDWQKIKAIVLTVYSSPQQYDYQVLSRIHNYAVTEIDALDKLYHNSSISNSSIQNALGLALLAIKQTDDNLPIKSLLEGKEYVYDLAGSNAKSFMINADTLPKSIENKPIMPSKIIVDTRPITLDNLSFTASVSAQKLSLIFDELPSIYIYPKVKAIEFPDGLKNCLYGSVANYSWQNSYQLTATIISTNGMNGIYIDKQNSPYIFDSKDEVDKSLIDNNMINYTITGNPNIKNVTIYFCADNLFDPSRIYKNIRITQKIMPQVYSIIDSSNRESYPPKISFTKINATQYIVRVTEAKSPYFLMLQQEYSPLWKLSNVTALQDSHFVANGYANGWYINKNGSYSLKITYSSQKYFLLGIWISLGALGLILLLLIGILIYERK